MNQPKETVLKEAMRLKDGELYGYLKEWRQDSLERLSFADETSFRMIQGEVAAIKAMIDLIEQARPTLEHRSKRTDMNKVF